MFEIIGSILGIIAFFWKVSDSFRSYIHISIDITNIGQDFALVKLQVDNRNLRRKIINNALLLVGPEDESPVNTCKIILKEKIRIGLSIILMTSQNVNTVRPYTQKMAEL